MSFKEHDKKTYIADLARDFSERRISKRSFLKKAGLAGVGFSAFNVALLGNKRRDRGFTLGEEAMAQDAESPSG
jgi:multiple sugar transport system substrate-binding protein